MDNPYQSPPPMQVYVHRTVMLDPSGAPVTLGESIERTVMIDGQLVTEVTTTLPQTAEGVLLTEPRVVYRCHCCGSQPLLRAIACLRCGGATCLTCIDEMLLICRTCAHRPWWQRLMSSLGGVAGWLKP